MRRGEIWTVAGGGDFMGKPRPVVILQDDRFADTGSVTFCPFTTNPTEAPFFRLEVQPTAENGLQAPSRLMVDKITTLRRTRLGRRLGRLGSDEMTELRQAVLVFLGFSGEPDSEPTDATIGAPEA